MANTKLKNEAQDFLGIRSKLYDNEAAKLYLANEVDKRVEGFRKHLDDLISTPMKTTVGEAYKMELLGKVKKLFDAEFGDA